jgi:hypothetical protein
VVDVDVTDCYPKSAGHGYMDAQQKKIRRHFCLKINGQGEKTSTGNENSDDNELNFT